MNEHYKFELKPLPYAYDALETQISDQTLHFHHDKHLQTYVDNLNKALENQPQYQSWALEELLKRLDELPESIRTAVRNNGGGVYNHQLYFDGMAPVTTTMPHGKLKDAIVKTFGSLEEMQKQLKTAATGRFGSGWAYLVCNSDGQLEIMSTPNQDTPLAVGSCPVLIVDVWEHAYYLDYQNRRPDYFDSWYMVINWDMAEQRFEQCCCK